LNTPAPQPIRSENRALLRLEADCDYHAVRQATLAARAWLAERGVGDTELSELELLMVEAGNNAVKHARPEHRRDRIVLEITAGNQAVEIRVIDHTLGFDWPDTIELPDLESEHGRGLYLMQSLTNEANYLRSGKENTLVLRRNLGLRPPVPAEELEKKLAEAETALADMTAELSSSYESLVAMFRYSAELGKNIELADFTRRLLRDLLQIAEADYAVLRLASADGRRLETLNMQPETAALLPALTLSQAAPAAEVAAARTRQDVWFSPEEPLDPRDPLAALVGNGCGLCHAFVFAEQLVGTVAFGRFAPDKPFSAAQVNLLHTFIDFLAIQIINARLLDERTAARVTRRELQIAADIQRSLLPATLPACPPFELSSVCQSALQVGGDFFDVIQTGEGDTLLVIADVMGKGVPAALFAAVLRSTIRSMPQLFRQPGELLEAINHTLFEDLSRVDMFVTTSLVYLDARHRQLISASAGHCPLLVWQPETSLTETAGNSGFPLGIESRTQYPQTVTPMPPGAVALLYTDGISEAKNESGEMFGDQALARLLGDIARTNPRAQAGKTLIQQGVAAFSGKAAMSDDQTFIYIRHVP
jgi:serine phosphatase RsbU (regulator of sigma subunit)/anti-sigma regulatory factor (Ser/Thr protein kinase)